MMKDKKIGRLDDETLAEAFVLPHGLTEVEKAAADLELKRLRLLRLGQMTEQQQLYAELLRLKYLIMDYLQYGHYEISFGLGAFLKKYLIIIGRTQKAFASEISLHPTKLNQILKDKADISVALAYRLEKHSGGIIPATMWWNLHARKIEALISQDHITQTQEAKKVKHPLAF